MIILSGTVGSVAYGLDTPGSDRDTLGVFVRPTRSLVGLSVPTETIVSHNPDSTSHEVGKFVRLALKCNPSVTELLWLDEYDHRDCNYGVGLVGLREKFLSTSYVRNAYGGYAKQQASLLSIQEAPFTDKLRLRLEKRGRHTFRLLWQGQQLLANGWLTVRLTKEQRDKCFGMGRLAGTNPQEFYHRFIDEDERFKRVGSVLPEVPDTDAVEDWLVRLRQEIW